MNLTTAEFLAIRIRVLLQSLSDGVIGSLLHHSFVNRIVFTDGGFYGNLISSCVLTLRGSLT